VSHQTERRERDCLNCGATVQGRFCQNCSQENVISHQSFWSLARHFVYDIFHFDGKFFDTLRTLMFSPGLVAREYIRGKRVRFLDPIRMYLFTSAVLFLVFVSWSPQVEFNSENYWLLDRAERMELVMVLSERAKQQADDATIQNQLSLLVDSTRQIELKTEGNRNESELVSFRGRQYHMYAKVDTAVATGGWLQRVFFLGTEKFKQKYRKDYDAGAKKVFSTFLRRLPYVFFLSLPFIAALLHLLYRKNKALFYSDHAIFTLYHYIFTFILLLLIIIFDSLFNWSKWSIFTWVVTLLVIAGPVHLYIGMKNFYGNSYGRTFANFLLLTIFGLIILAFLFVIVFLVSFLT
jgi:hypothetical protein